MIKTRSESGFSLIELLVAMGVLLIVSSIVTAALLQMTSAQMTIWNRTEMHSGVRGATELLQQEVGQAGRIALPAPVTLSTATAAIAIPPVAQTLTVSSTANMFVGEFLVFDTGDNRETVSVTAVNTGTNQVTGIFTLPHAVGAPVS